MYYTIKDRVIWYALLDPRNHTRLSNPVWSPGSRIAYQIIHNIVNFTLLDFVIWFTFQIRLWILDYLIRNIWKTSPINVAPLRHPTRILQNPTRETTKLLKQSYLFFVAKMNKVLVDYEVLYAERGKHQLKSLTWRWSVEMQWTTRSGQFRKAKQWIISFFLIITFKKNGICRISRLWEGVGRK